MDVLIELNEKSDKGILIIRHSERYSFEGLPIDQREYVEITPNGIEMARDFGKAIRNMYPNSKLNLFHSPATRCIMTAKYLAEGHDPDKKNTITPEVSLGSPIEDPVKYYDLRTKYKWIEFNKRWVNGEFSEEAIKNSKKYANAILGKMLKMGINTDNSIAIFVAHDMTLYPLIGHIFGIDSICPINFLEGLSFVFKDESVDVWFRDVKKSIETKDLII